MTRFKSEYSLIAILLLSMLTASAVAATYGEAITAAQVAAAMNAAGMAISPQQVTLLAEVTSRTSRPRLQVESTSRWGDDRLRVRLDCANPSACLPFIVAVHSTPQNPLPPVAETERPSAVTRPPHAAEKSVLVRAGMQVVLLLDGGRVHIRFRVVCLQSGVTGQTIHVASQDHRQTYTAVVVDGSTVRAGL